MDDFRFYISEHDYRELDRLCTKQRNAWLAYTEVAHDPRIAPQDLHTARLAWVEAGSACCGQLERILMMHKLTADILATGPGHGGIVGT